MTFDDYKERVSIAQILEDLGYQQDLSKGKISPVYKKLDAGGNKIDEVVIRDPNSPRQHYFDRNNKGGDVITFVKNHINDFPSFQHNNVFVRLNMILSHYANTAYVPSYHSQQNISKKEPIEFSLDQYNLRKPTIAELGFLTRERGLSLDTVTKFAPFIMLAHNKRSKGNYYNIAFPYINPMDDNNNIRNFEFRNYGFKGMATGGDKSNSIWAADFSANKALVKNVYLFESAIDAMSFFQLFKDKIDLKSSVFASIGGYVSDNQIKNTIQAYPNATINTGFDKDLNGHIYDIKVHSLLANSPLKIEVQKDGLIGISTDKYQFHLHKDQLSLQSFREKSHSYVPMKAYKPTTGKDFNEVLLSLGRSRSLKI